jgi:hypothetical protein
VERSAPSPIVVFWVLVSFDVLESPGVVAVADTLIVFPVAPEERITIFAVSIGPAG